MKAISRTTRRWLLLVLLLLVETEVLIDPRYEMRTFLRALLHFPLYHILLGFLGFMGLLRVAVPDRVPRMEVPTPSPAWLIAHLGCFAALEAGMDPLWAAGLTPLVGSLWLLATGIFLGTWMAAMVPPRAWPTTFRAHAPWLAAALAVGTIAFWTSQASNLAWNRLAAGTFLCSRALLASCFSHIVSDPGTLTLGTRRFQVRILAGCSGCEGMGLIATFTVAYLWLRRKELWLARAVWMLPAGVTVIWLANSIRLALLVAVGSLLSPAIAARGFHSQAGWIFFSIVSIGLVLVVERQPWFHRRCEAGAPAPWHAAAGLVLPLLVLLAFRMLSRATTAGSDALYLLRIGLVAAVVWRVRSAWRPLLGKPAWGSSLLLGLVGYAIWAVLVPGSSHAGTGSGWWILARLVGAGAVVPLVEEMAFRGYLLRRLQSSNFERVRVGSLTVLSVAVSSAVYGLLYREWLAAALAGAVYAFATRRGRLADAVAAHSTTNLCLAIQVLFFHHGSLPV